MTNLASLKAARIRVSSSYGDINVGGSLYGNVDLLTAGEGSLNVHKIQVRPLAKRFFAGYIYESLSATVLL